MRVNITLPGLIHLAHTKNELNRRRRRFYNLMDFGHDNYMRLARGQKGLGLCIVSQKEAIKGYEKAKQDMKDLTSDMRQIRQLLGAKIIWGWSGNITHILYQEKCIPASKFEAMSKDYMAEAILLGFGR